MMSALHGRAGIEHTGTTFLVLGMPFNRHRASLAVLIT
jgi:hypothetical protein